MFLIEAARGRVYEGNGLLGSSLGGPAHIQGKLVHS